MRLAFSSSLFDAFQAVRHLEKPRAVRHCLLEGVCCPHETECALRETWCEIQEAFETILNTTSMAWLARNTYYLRHGYEAASRRPERSEASQAIQRAIEETWPGQFTPIVDPSREQSLKRSPLTEQAFPCYCLRGHPRPPPPCR